MPKKNQDIENKSTKSTTAKEDPSITPIRNTDVFLIVGIGEIHASETVPQEHRRRRFNENNLSELAESIRQKGIIEPLVVRRNDAGYELVCGERRWLAATRAGLQEIPVVVKELDENQVLEIQLDENLHREDVHPMDEAVWYQFIKEKYTATNSELALRVGKNEKYIAGRLKLNNLIDEVREDFELDRITFSHALEIAKFPANSQKEILDLCFDTRWDNASNGWVPDKDDLKPLHDLREEIESEILLSLKSATFDITATNLREDNLPCSKCPERSGAKVKNLLFEDYEEFFKDSKDDRCLNPACFGLKTMRFVQITRAEKSAEVIAGGGRPNDYQIRLVSWQPHNAVKVENFFGEKPLVDGEYRRINFENNPSVCSSAEYGIFADNSGYLGDIIGICADKDCKKHFGSASSSASSSKDASPLEDEKERKKRLDRKEEIFDSKVGEPVRLLVLAEAAKYFNAEKTIANHPSKSAEFSFMLLARMWQMQYHYSRRTAGAIADILGVKAFGKNLWKDHTEDIKKLPPEKQSQLFFLLLVAHIGEITEGYWENQDEIIELAETFGINYKLLDAQKRLELAPNKFKRVAKEYLVAVEAGNNTAKLPRFYSADYGLKVKASSKIVVAEDLELEETPEDFEEQDEIDENDLGETSQG